MNVAVRNDQMRSVGTKAGWAGRLVSGKEGVMAVGGAASYVAYVLGCFDEQVVTEISYRSGR